MNRLPLRRPRLPPVVSVATPRCLEPSRRAPRIANPALSWSLALLIIPTALLACSGEREPRSGPPAQQATGGEGGSAGAGSGGVPVGGHAEGGQADGGLGGTGITTEQCFNGTDDDGDLLRDCADEECAATCADPCGHAVPLALPAWVSGDTSGRGGGVEPSCVAATGGGPAVAYRIEAATDCVVDLLLSSNADLSLSARGSCEEQGQELGCAERTSGTAAVELLTVPVSSGEPVFVLVSGQDPDNFGPYTLQATLRVPSCGDAHTDRPAEQCDDGGHAGPDGCDATCQLETTEVEPANNTVGGADPYLPLAGYWYAALAPAGDIDHLRVDVGTDGATVSARTYDFGDGACAGWLMDTVVELLDTDGTTVLASDDDTEGGCSMAVSSPLPAGSYSVRVSAAQAADPPVFGYVLEVIVSP